MITSTLTFSSSGMSIKGLATRAKLLGRSVANVGVLARTAARDNSHLAPGSTNRTANNAEVGLEAEFGSATPYRAIDSVTGDTITGPGVPERSFLRMPLQNELPKHLETVASNVLGVFTGAVDLKLPVQALGEAGVETVKLAFDTGGFGQWPANSPRTSAWKGRNEPLVDTGQLRGSIAYEVKKA